jgi:histidinol-phosphate aminotransferase
MSDILKLARPDLLKLQAYEHAAWEPSLERLHANEMPWRASGDETSAGLNRYPEPLPIELARHLAALYEVPLENLLPGRGSDESIDLLCRAFLRAGQDKVVICPPTFGMYKVAARVQGAAVVEVPLLRDKGYTLDRAGILAACDSNTKIVFVCSPNNPTGNLIDRAEIEALCTALDGRALVVVDEAYVEFAQVPSLTRELRRFENLVVLRTLSKAFALAGARCGVVIADAAIIELLTRIIPPYSMPTPTIETVLRLTDQAHVRDSRAKIATILAERGRLIAELARLPLIRRVWPSDTNFILIECADADRVLASAIDARLIVRDPRSNPLLKSCLRISVGAPEQNARLVRSIAAASGAAA